MAKERISQEMWLSQVIASLSDASIRSPLGDRMPGFPSEERQKNTTSIAGEQALRQANGFYCDICNVIDPAGLGLHAGAAVLDFGSCWGRITRFFMRDVSVENLHGIDVVSEFVDECRQLFGTNNFNVCNPLPPCEISSSSIHLITAYSVFSHLSENAFHAWMKEFHRILRPGGVLAFTTRSEVFLDYCKQLRESAGPHSNYGSLSIRVVDSHALIGWAGCSQGFFGRCLSLAQTR